MNRDFKGIWISRELWLSKNLSLLSRILWAEIDSLYSDEHGGCYASNEYLCEFLEIKITRLKELLKELKDAGILEIVSFDGRKRILKALPLSRIQTAGKTASRRSPNDCLPAGKAAVYQPEKRPPLYKDDNKVYNNSLSNARKSTKNESKKSQPVAKFEEKGVHKLGTLPKKEILEAEDGLPSINLSAVQIDVMTKQAMDEGLTIEEAKPLVQEVILAYRLECGANQCMHDKPYFAIRKWLIHAVKKYKDEKSKGHKLKLSVTTKPESEQSPAELLKKRPEAVPFSKEALDKFFS